MVNKIIWDEMSIREEIKKLDAITGLSGAKLPIRFNKAWQTLGSYQKGTETEVFFTFSDYYFKNPNWPVELAINTIRHEYAHYMDDCIYGKSGHGRTWKICCNRIGAIPVRYYSEDQEYYWRNIYRNRKEEQERFKAYTPGILLLHPKYGFGIIKSVEGSSTGSYITVSFDEVGVKTLSLSWVKTLSLSWVDKNCACEL